MTEPNPASLFSAGKFRIGPDQNTGQKDRNSTINPEGLPQYNRPCRSWCYLSLVAISYHSLTISRSDCRERILTWSELRLPGSTPHDPRSSSVERREFGRRGRGRGRPGTWPDRPSVKSGSTRPARPISQRSLTPDAECVRRRISVMTPHRGGLRYSRRGLRQKLLCSRSTEDRFLRSLDVSTDESLRGDSEFSRRFPKARDTPWSSILRPV